MNTLKYFFFVLFLFFASCSPRTIYLRSDNSQPVNYEGVYESSDGFSGRILKIEKGNRFVDAWWTDVGGALDSTTGRWEPTNTLGIIRLYSDKIPKPNVFTSDSSLKGFKIIINEGFYDTLNFVSAEIRYADTLIYRKPNADGVIILSNETPRYIKLFDYLSFHSIHIIDSADCEYSSEWAKKEFGVKSIISCAKPYYNVINITMQEEYEYNNGDAFLLYNDKAYSLKYGLIKIKY